MDLPELSPRLGVVGDNTAAFRGEVETAHTKALFGR
jgi:hypothetical protein